MRVTAISDLHGHYPDLPGGDLLIVAGDLTAGDKLPQYEIFFRWLEKQSYRKKIVVAGNHDNFCKQWGVTSEIDNCYQMMYPDEKEFFDYLCDSECEFEGVRIWGTPWTERFDGINPKCCAFTYDREYFAEKKFSLIPEGIDILVSHGPAKYILDQVKDFHDGTIRNTGSIDLHRALERVKPSYFVFGHIHENGGKQLLFKHHGPNTVCLNCSYVDENYKPLNKIWNFEINKP